MPDKPKILFIGDYCRHDYLSLLKDAVTACDFYFLYYTSAIEETNNHYTKFGQAIYWADFKDSNELLRMLKPVKVVFLYIESYNHVVLNLASKQAAIPTYHLEHGLRADYTAGFDPATSPPPAKKITKTIKGYLKLLTQLAPRLKSRRFLRNSIKTLLPEDAAFVKHFMQVRSQLNYLETFRKIKSPKRNPLAYISFSPEVFKVHEEHDDLPADYPVHFIGVPYFDNLASVKAGEPGKNILFIDQPLAEHHLLQWTELHKRNLIEVLYSTCKEYEFKLFVKLHPKQKDTAWADPVFSDVFQIIEHDDLPEVARKVGIVMGFYSTLLMPFAAMPHITILTLENHPAGKLHLSKAFINTGTAHPIYNLKELPWALENIEQLHRQQLPHKERFKAEWLYKFDGKAGERLRDILLSNTL